VEESTVADAATTGTARSGRPVWLIALVVGLVLVLAGGLIAWRLLDRPTGRAPFDQALASLAAAEGITYHTSLAGLDLSVRETRHGESIGTMTLAGQHFGLLSLGGLSYLRLPASFVPPGISGSADSLAKAPADGLTIEAALGGNMPPRNRVVDTYVADDGGTAVSVKSLDWRGTSYQLSPSLIKSLMETQIDLLVNYRAGVDLRNPTPDPKDVTVWVFQMAFPANPPSPFLELYQSLVAYGAARGIIVQLIPIDG
jgi:hypothetical protein